MSKNERVVFVPVEKIKFVVCYTTELDNFEKYGVYDFIDRDGDAFLVRDKYKREVWVDASLFLLADSKGKVVKD